MEFDVKGIVSSHFQYHSTGKAGTKWQMNLLKSRDLHSVLQSVLVHLLADSKAAIHFGLPVDKSLVIGIRVEEPILAVVPKKDQSSNIYLLIKY